MKHPIYHNWQTKCIWRSKQLLKDSKSNGGSLTVESSLGLLVFVSAMVSLMLIIQNVGFSEAVHQSLYETAQEISAVDVRTETECLALGTALFYTKLDHSQALSKGLLLSKAELSPEGEVKLTATWRVSLPIGGYFRQSYSLRTRLLTRGSAGLADDASQRVYVTETGSKYHVLGCNHLRSSSIPIWRKEAIESGYTPCWHCIGGLKPFEPAPGPLEE